MKTKTKKFSKKLLALFLAVVMALTGFAGAMTAFADDSYASYVDDAVDYNSIGWAVLTDEQVATALLDYADSMLEQYGPQIDSLLASVLPTSGMYYWDYTSRSIGINVAGIIKASVDVYTHSLNELFHTLNSVQSLINSYSSFIGNAGYLHLDVGDMTRENTTSCNIIRTVLGILQRNCGDYYGNDDVGTLLRGEFSLGTVGNLANIDLYSIIQNALGLPDDYQDDLVYNIAKHFLLNNSGWFTQTEINKYSGNDNSNFVYDTVLLEKLTSELLCKINVLVTYPDGTNSSTRRDQIDEKMASGMSYAEAAKSLGYDPNLVYSEENTGNVLLFAYGDEKISLGTSDTLFSLGYQALDLAWKTVLQDTIKLIHVNNNNFSSTTGTNFDNQYYYWAKDNITGGWDKNNLSEMYSEANLNAWANAVYESYNAASAEDFLDQVKADYELSRTATGEGKWSDIDPTRLFLKIRYSPLADYGFNMQTGPLNLYLMQTGTPNLDSFFGYYDRTTDKVVEGSYKSQYKSLAGALNDALVAAVKDLFVDSDNIYVNKVGDTSRPTMVTINPTGTIGTTEIKNIANTITSNALELIQYVADTTDQNILKAFYDANSTTTTLTEQNVESAMIPLLIACIGEINLGSGKLSKLIHPDDWDMCKDAEAVAYLCLRENLSFSIPNIDYDNLVTISTESDGSKKINATLEGTIIPMARDAVIYVMEAYVPVTDTNGNAWIAENPDHSDADVFDLFNSVVCYYGGDITSSTRPSTERANGIGALIGLCDNNGNSTITKSNDLWTNINLAVNKLLPVVGTLLGDGYGKADSKDLLYNDIIKGILEIGDTSIHESGMGGVSNLLYRLLTVFCAEPIQTTPVINTVYNLLADLINGLFGARYSQQEWTTIIPANTSSHPFDDLVKKTSLAGTGGSDVGIIQKLICLFVEYTGQGVDGNNTYPDSMMRGIAFALQAVNSFIPEAINNISEHSMSMATVSFDDPVAKGTAASGRVNVYFTNNSTGVNTAYIDGKNMNEYTPEQMGRYYVKLTDIPTVTYSGAYVTAFSDSSWQNSYYGKIIDPGETISFPISIRLTEAESTVNIQFHYDIVDEDGNALYSGLSSTGTKFGTNTTEWVDATYNDSYQFPDYPSKASTSSEVSKSTNDVYATTAFSDMYALMPADMILTSDNLAALDNYQIAFVSSSEKEVEGFYCYETGSVTNDTGSSVNVTSDNAIAICDDDGNLIKTGLYDFSDNGVWDTNNGNGYTSDQLGEKLTTAINNGHTVTQRTHVVYTLSAAKNAGIVAAAHKDADGNYDAIYLNNGSGNYSYSTLLTAITLRGPVDGTIINKSDKLTVSGGPIYTSVFQYDGSTHIAAGKYPINMCIYTSGSSYYTNNELIPFNLYVGGEDSSQDALNQYDEIVAYLANYKEDDFTSSETLTKVQDYLKQALQLLGTAVTADSILKFADPTALNAVTHSTTSETGDVAYQAFTTSNATKYGMPDSLKAIATVGSSSNNGKTGVYYYDADCTMPIYSNQLLTTPTLGKDNAGIPVVAGTGDDADKYFLANDVLYEQIWDTKSFKYPWLTDSDVQATDDMGNLLYSQTEYMYVDSDGNKVGSNDDWAAKYAITDTTFVQKDGQVDGRGYYTLASDCISYAEYLINSGLKPGISDALLYQMSLVRSELEEYNFDVVTYNKMVKLAKTAENQYSVNLTYTYDEPVLDENGDPTYDTDGNPVTTAKTKTITVPFLTYKEYADNSDYTINSVAVKSTLSSTQVAEYIRLFDFYTSKIVERGYLGNQLEKEIVCASGNTYTALNATAATYNEDGTIATEAVITKGTGAVTPDFGTWSADGTLVNEGDKVYTDASWSAYTAALADAVLLAQHGNSDYTYQARDYFNIDDNDNYDAQVTDCYSVDSRLQVAENSLEEFGTATITVASVEGGTVSIDGTVYTAPVTADLGDIVTVEATADLGYEFGGFKVGDTVINSNPYTFTVKGDVAITPIFTSAGKTVSGDIVVATSYTGVTANKAAYGNYTIDIYDESGATLIGSFESTYDAENFTNTFSLTLPEGTYKAIVSYEYALTRDDITITVGADNIEGVVIPMIACDFKIDTLVNVNDIRIVKSATNDSTGLEYCDLNADGIVNINDVRIAKACSAASPDMSPVEIK